MMYNQKSKRSRRLSAVALVPALAIGLYAANIPTVASAIGTLGNAEMTLEQAADKGTNKSIQQQANEGFTELDTQPEFPGGMEELYKFISANINYPENAPVKELGSVTVSFTVKADGSVTNPKILVGDDEAFNKEALKLVGKMPKWKPGTRKGKAVDVIYGMPINFKRPKPNFNGGIVAVSDGNTTKDFIMLEETNVVRYNEEPTIYIDGVKADADAMHKLKPNDIESMTIDKSANSGKTIKITLKK